VCVSQRVKREEYEHTCTKLCPAYVINNPNETDTCVFRKCGRVGVCACICACLCELAVCMRDGRPNSTHISEFCSVCLSVRRLRALFHTSCLSHTCTHAHCRSTYLAVCNNNGRTLLCCLLTSLDKHLLRFHQSFDSVLKVLHLALERVDFVGI